MNVCSDGHDEIVYLGGRKDCPLCRAIVDIDGLRSNIGELEKQRDNHECEVPA